MYRSFASEAEFLNELKTYEEETAGKYIYLHRDKTFGTNDVHPSAHKKISWELKSSPFNGVPFQVVGSSGYECHQGQDRHLRDKEKYAAESEKRELEDHSFVKRAKYVHTKKMDCKAMVNVAHIVCFPGYKIADSRERTKKEASRALKIALSTNPASVHTETLFCARFPLGSDHSQHPVVGEAAGVVEPVNTRVRSQIEQLTMSGVGNLTEMKKHLERFVSDEILHGDTPPVPTRRRYHPTNTDIRNAMFKAKEHTRMSAIDQEHLKVLSETWASQLHYSVHFRTWQELEDGTETRLLYCLQSTWQKRLLHLYGQRMCLLDAAYRTCRGSLPLYFLCVRTNVSCRAVVVGAFVTQQEVTSDVREALSVFKKWNPEWKPRHFLVDFSEAEVAALEGEFPGSRVFVCDVHREEAWGEWCRRKEHGLGPEGDSVLQLLRRVAGSSTQEEFTQNLTELRESKPWAENEKLRAWFSNTWLPQAQKWVPAFRDEEMKVAMTLGGGVVDECQNQALKHGYLNGSRNCSLTELMTDLVTELFPSAYHKYLELNIKYSLLHSQNNQATLSFLKDMPRRVAAHISQEYESASSYRAEDVVAAGEGLFHVKSQTDATPHHTVLFGSQRVMPRCSCGDWQQHRLPCRHFCAVFRLVEGWGWSRLGSVYKDNPLLTLDKVCLGAATTAGTERNSTVCHVNREVPVPPRRSARKTKLRRECAGYLEEIMDLTYDLQDETYMTQLADLLQDLLLEVKTHTPRDKGLTLKRQLPASQAE